MSIGENIKLMRESKGLTQEELAQELNINRSMIALIETGRKNPSIPLLRDISIALKCKTDDLIKT